ncbi:MAG: n-acetylmuramoyl-l-alanine amidase [Chthoniobacteraceae bacterium]|nr:n-acetylmuramoyl-l-alanine amidase [Chthoniobacteraceae bacterium]
MKIKSHFRVPLLLAACLLFHSEMQAAWSTPDVIQELIPSGRYGRRIYRPFRPTYITIHSTDNTSRGADAHSHAVYQKSGKSKGRHNIIGYVAWHFTVDDHSTYQSLPTNERGEHADYDGPGNQTSIGIEMCVNRDGNRQATIDRTARLTAWLMRKHRIPLNHVVPHMHWRQIRHDDHKDLGYKKCPSILLDRGQLGPKWAAFISRVRSYY